jgi:hypothetical protein
MLAGHFKLGTLSEYRSGERASGTHSDRHEGLSERYIPGTGRLPNGWIGTNYFEGNTSNFDRGFVVSNSTDANVFCVSNGGYDKHRHHTLLSGTGTYAANPSLKAYVVIDRDRLKYAIDQLRIELGLMEAADRRVFYGLRAKALTIMGERFHVTDAQLQSDLDETIFIKPPEFIVEDEYRFALKPHQPGELLSAIYTRDCSIETVNLFRDAIADHGAKRPF